MKKVIFFYNPGKLKPEPDENLKDFFKSANLELTICKNYNVTITEKAVFDNQTNLKFEDFDFALFYITKAFQIYEPIEQYLLNYCKQKKIKNLVIGYRGLKGYKMAQFETMSKYNLNLIPTIITNNYTHSINFINSLNYEFPIIVKPLSDSEGAGVLKIKSAKELANLLDEKKPPNIIQPFFENDGDFRVWVINGKIVGVIKRTPTVVGEFRANIALGGKAEISNLPKSVLKKCILFVKKMNLDCAGVDVLRNTKTKKYYFLECNSPMGREGFTSATGINLFDYLAKEIKTLV